MPLFQEGLNPRQIADKLGISLAQLSLRLGVSYWTVHAWSRRNSAPLHVQAWIASQIPLVQEALTKERETLPPVEQAKQISKPARFPILRRRR